jgi:hypothetical protein
MTLSPLAPASVASALTSATGLIEALRKLAESW